MIGYQAQVIPALLAGLALAYLERFWRRHIPEVVSMIFVPFLSLIPALILAHTVLGPVGWTIGKGISAVVLAGLTGPVKWLFGAIFGALYAPLVITGLHHMTNAIDTQLVQVLQDYFVQALTLQPTPLVLVDFQGFYLFKPNT